MQYNPETIFTGKIITAEWGQKIENMFQRIGHYMGVVETPNDLPDVQVAQESDWYIVRSEKQIYAKINGEWVNIGVIYYSQMRGTVPRQHLSGTYDIDITGSQGEQVKLKYQRTINGVPFDGTQNITISQTTPGAITFSATGGQQPGSTFNGSSNLTVSFQTVGAQAEDHTHSEYLSRDGGSMNTTSVVTNLNQDFVDGFDQNQFLLKSGDTMNGVLNCNSVVNCNQSQNSRFILPVGTNKWAT